MATNSNWTVVFEDKKIIKNNGAESGTAYDIVDNTFWSQEKFSNIWSIQYGTGISTDEVEHRDSTPHSTYASSNLGDFNEFINRWDSSHLITLQSVWDESNVEGETEATKITRIGARPTSYSSL